MTRAGWDPDRPKRPTEENDPADTGPSCPTIRCTVVRVDQPRGVMRVGDRFEIRGSQLMIPPGRSISPDAFAAVATVIALRQTRLPADNWLVRKPFICGPDAAENLVLEVEAFRGEGESR